MRKTLAWAGILFVMRRLRARRHEAPPGTAGAAAQPGRTKVTLKPVDDEVLEARVRAKLGHLVSRPHSIDVSVHEGEVILRGTADAGELAELLRGVKSVWGVRRVKNQLVQRTG